MGTKNNLIQSTDTGETTPPIVQAGPLDTTKFNQEIKKKRKPYKKRQQAEGWELEEEERKKEEQAEKDDPKYLPLCHAPGITRTIKVLFEKGVLLGTVLDYKLFKIPFDYLPDPICDDVDSQAWAESLIDILIDSYGSKEAYGKLRLLAIFGIPMTIIAQNHYEGMNKKQVAGVKGAIAGK